MRVSQRRIICSARIQRAAGPWPRAMSQSVRGCAVGTDHQRQQRRRPAAGSSQCAGRPRCHGGTNEFKPCGTSMPWQLRGRSHKHASAGSERRAVRAGRPGDNTGRKGRPDAFEPGAGDSSSAGTQAVRAAVRQTKRVRAAEPRHATAGRAVLFRRTPAVACTQRTRSGEPGSVPCQKSEGEQAGGLRWPHRPDSQPLSTRRLAHASGGSPTR
jgi:hypothetical protein